MKTFGKTLRQTFGIFTLTAALWASPLGQMLELRAQAQSIPSRVNQTVLNINGAGAFTVSVNGRTVGTFRSTGNFGLVARRDISGFVHGGTNTLRIQTVPGSNKSLGNLENVPSGYIKVAFARRKNEFKDLNTIFFRPVAPGVKHKYVYTSTFTIDALSQGATTARTDAATPFATSGKGYNSRPRQTLLIVNTQGDVAVSINGRRVETFSSTAMRRDITRYVKRGSNTIAVKLLPNTNSGAALHDGVPIGYVQVAYAGRQNQFKTLNNIQFGSSNPGRTAKMNYRATFTLN